jgi:acyl carrier protein phosphodiesterase
MNYLAHLLLAGEDPQAQLGSLLGDFTRGRIETLARRYPASVIHGISVHRKIDRYTDDHESVVRSKRRFSPQRARYSGIIVDVLHDHLLSRHWDCFADIGRQAFIARSYSLLSENEPLLPERLQRVAPTMIAQDWLGSYLELDAVDRVYQRLSTRISRENPLAGAIEEVFAHYDELEKDFLSFFPDVQSHAARLNDHKVQEL